SGPVWRGSAARQVSGGGLRLRSLPVVLPGLLALLHETYGDLLLGLAVLGAAFCAARNRIAFVGTVPYIVVSLLFYGCWGKADARYLLGTHLLLPALIVAGVFAPFEIAARLAAARPARARLLSAGFAITVLAVGTWDFLRDPASPRLPIEGALAAA